MKLAIIIGLVIILGGVGSIIYASGEGGAYRRIDKFEPLWDANTDAKRFGIEVQITRLQSKHKPLQFQGHRLFKEGEVPSMNEREISVVYDGNDAFELNKGSQVFVEGIWDHETKTLKASKVSTQCPSHYQGEAVK